MKNKLLKYSTFFFAFFIMAGSVSAADTVIKCGADIIGIPVGTAKIIQTTYVLIKILVPVVLIFMGMLDFGRAVVGSSEEDIKKKQKSFIKRLIAAFIIYLVLAIVELVFALLASSGAGDFTACIDAVLNGKF